MSTDSEDSELLALRNELLQGLKSKKLPNKNQNLIVESSNDDEELEKLRLQALEAKKLAKNTHNLDDKKTKLPGRFRYDRESEEEDDDEEFEIEIYNNKKTYQSDQENDDQKIKSDDFLDKYQKYRDRCTRIMSNEAYEPGLITSNLKETLNNLDLKRLLNENGEEIDSESKYAKTDLILEQLDYAYRPITEPICIKRNEIYINTNFRPKIKYQKNTFRNGETRYWKNNNNYIKLKQNEDEKKNLDDAYEEDLDQSNFEDDEDDFQKNKKLKSIVQQVVKTNNKRDDSNISSNDRHHYSNYKRRRRYYSSSSR
ncbi:unnamed protein product [Brachionus calyciflorus]|uniref:Uncharacterized protein n=1 Tax=Brachionus calyciflorus TaxID=104777 RepID=A0A813P7R2_9BILA|nr:unnamed protein product [Brachionus calyciflorus]